MLFPPRFHVHPASCICKLVIPIVFVIVVPAKAFGQGACCLFPNNCEVLSASDCNDRDGTFNGNGTSCFSGACPTLGACCATDGCEVRTEADCTSSGLSYQGDGVSCADATCSAGGDGEDDDDDDDDPIPTDTLGACCLFTENCEDTTAGECNVVGGEFEPGISCQNISCENTLACCLPSGDCTVIASDLCQIRNGQVISRCIACDGIDLDQDDIAPDTPGACCLFTENCEDITAGECNMVGGDFVPGLGCRDLSCENVTACCLASGGCTVIASDLCERGNGQPTDRCDECAPGDETACGGDCGPSNFGSAAAMIISGMMFMRLRFRRRRCTR